MIQGAPRRIRAGFGCVGALLLTATAVVAIAYGNGEYDGGYEVHATFPRSAQGLYTDGGSDVKLRGVDIGSVSGLALQDDGTVRVTLRIDDDVVVPDTVVATIEPLSIFGPKFVRLQPGEVDGEGRALRPGDEVPATGPPVDLTEILASATRLFEQVDPADVVVILDAVAEGVGGLGPELGRTIDAVSELAGVGARHAEDTRTFLRDLATLTRTLADHAEDLRATVVDLDAALPVLNERPGRLDALLDATTGIAGTFADLLAENDEEVDATIRAVATFVDGVSARAEQIPDFLHLIDSFFGRLSDIIRFDGPGDTQMAGLRGFISLDPCLVYGVCL